MNVEDLAAGVYSPDDGWLDPHSLLTAFRNKAKSMGVEFISDEVTGLERQGHAVTASSDLYSVGVILYELLTGVVPFEGETAVAIAFKQVAAEPRPPSELNPLLPASLDMLVLRALAKDSSQRYADAEEFITALQHEYQTLALYSPAPAPVAAGARAADPPAHRSGGDHGGGGALLMPPVAPYPEDDGAPPREGGRRRWPWPPVRSTSLPSSGRRRCQVACR